MCRRPPWGAGGKTRHNHVGEDGARLGEVEGDECRVHSGLPQILSSPQEFRIDRADLVEHCAQLAEVVDQSGNLHMSVVGHVVSSRSPAGLADGQISLRTVSQSVDAVALGRPQRSPFGASREGGSSGDQA